MHIYHVSDLVRIDYAITEAMALRFAAEVCNEEVGRK
jgi:hypothetical protein